MSRGEWGGHTGFRSPTEKERRGPRGAPPEWTPDGAVVPSGATGPRRTRPRPSTCGVPGRRPGAVSPSRRGRGPSLTVYPRPCRRPPQGRDLPQTTVPRGRGRGRVESMSPQSRVPLETLRLHPALGTSPSPSGKGIRPFPLDPGNSPTPSTPERRNGPSVLLVHVVSD